MSADTTPPSVEEHLASLMLQGLNALRQSHPDRAVGPLRELVEHPAWNGAEDLLDLYDRAQTLLAQALLESGEWDEAHRRLEILQRSARARQAQETLDAARELAGQVSAARKELQEAELRRKRLLELADWPEERVLASARSPFQLATLWIERAAGELERGQPEAAAVQALRGLALARELGATREEVLALLELARAQPERAPQHLSAAYKKADSSNEITLVGVVGRTAQLLGVPLTAVEGAALTRLA